MAGISFVLITLALAGVFAVFWWLVELTGGAAGQELSVCRSMQTGFVSWRDSRPEMPLEPVGTYGASGTVEPYGDDASKPLLDEGFEVPMERVRGQPKHRSS